jgi:hypothetical protein
MRSDTARVAVTVIQPALLITLLVSRQQIALDPHKASKNNPPKAGLHEVNLVSSSDIDRILHRKGLSDVVQMLDAFASASSVN